MEMRKEKNTKHLPAVGRRDTKYGIFFNVERRTPNVEGRSGEN
jgi:hypothetical protein